MPARSQTRSEAKASNPGTKRNSVLIAVAAIALVTACARGGTSQTATQPSQPEAAATASAQLESPAASVAQPQPAAATGSQSDGSAAAQTAPSPSGAVPNGQCSVVSADQVADIVHLKIQKVDVHADPDTCEFTFENASATAITVAYAKDGGPDEIKSIRQANGAAQAIFGGIISAAANGNSPQAQSVKNFVAGTPPPDVAHVGDDQYFFTAGPATSLIATKGDAYVQVSSLAIPEGLSRWNVLPEVAKRVLAAR